jgi:hypothetical protein
MKIKKTKSELIMRDKNGNVFKLNGNGVWVQITPLELFKLI